MSGSSALELRRAFDASFASEPAPPPERLDLLAVRVAGRPHALRVTEIVALAPLGEVVGLPEAPEGFLGVAAVRGQLVAVFDLGTLLGDGRGAAPRWLVLSAGREAVGLAFEELDGYLRVAPEDVTESGTDPGVCGVGELARVGAALRPVVSIPALLRKIGHLRSVNQKGS